MSCRVGLASIAAKQVKNIYIYIYPSPNHFQFTTLLATLLSCICCWGLQKGSLKIGSH